MTQKPQQPMPMPMPMPMRWQTGWHWHSATPFHHPCHPPVVCTCPHPNRRCRRRPPASRHGPLRAQRASSEARNRHHHRHRRARRVHVPSFLCAPLVALFLRRCLVGGLEIGMGCVWGRCCGLLVAVAVVLLLVGVVVGGLVVALSPSPSVTAIGIGIGIARRHHHQQHRAVTTEDGRRRREGGLAERRRHRKGAGGHCYGYCLCWCRLPSAAPASQPVGCATPMGAESPGGESLG